MSEQNKTSTTEQGIAKTNEQIQEYKDIIDTYSLRDEKIKIFDEHFPGALEWDSETKKFTLNANKLQLLLDPAKCKVEENGYELRWVGKKKAFHEAYSKLDKENGKLLEPVEEQSKNFDTTENIVIRGDNLEALKMLRKSYANKVKCIYIDPPYKTENLDFIYNDKFSMTEKELLDELGYDDDMKEYIENIFSAKTHSRWLTFIFPRLLLAREFLTEDGVIFVSIDDNEQPQLKLLMDEIFGEQNLMANLIVKSAPAGTQSSSDFAIQQSYCLAYKKTNNASINTIPLTEQELDNKYKLTDKDGNRYYLERLWKRGEGGRKEDVPSLHFPVYYNIEKDVIYIDDECEHPNQCVKIIPYQTANVLGRWTWSRQTMIESKQDLAVKKTSGEYKLYKKMYRQNDKGKKPYSMIDSNIARTELGSLEIKNLTGAKAFSYPKSTMFIKHLIAISTTNKDDIIIDFFAGSGTTGDAIMQLNNEDNGNRKFILIQIDEPINQTTNNNNEDDDETSSAISSFDFCTNNGLEPVISSITIERLNRAGDKIINDNKMHSKLREASLDIGYKVFKIVNDEYNSIYNTPTKEYIAKTGTDMLSVDTHLNSNIIKNILYSFMLVDGKTLDQPVITIYENKLYIVDNIAYFFADTTNDELNNLYEKYGNNIDFFIVYSLTQKISSTFTLELNGWAMQKGIDKDKIKIRG